MLTQVALLPLGADDFRLPKSVLAILGLGTVVLAVAATRAARGALVVPRSPMAAALAILPVLAAASSLWSTSPRASLTTAAVAAVWVAAALVLASLGPVDRARAAAWTVAGVLVSATVALTQASGLSPLRFGQGFANPRLGLTGLAGNPADLAAAAALMLAFVLVHALEQRRPRSWLVAALLTVTVVAVQSLTGAIAVASMAGVLTLIRVPRRRWPAAVGIAGVALVVLLGAGLGSRLAELGRMVASSGWYGGLSARGDGWTAALEMIRARPVLGSGAGTFGCEFTEARLGWLDRHGGHGRRGELATHFDAAHNDLLQLQAELGLAGSLWALLVAVAAVRSRRRRDLLPVLGTVAALPFLLLSFPTHLAVTLGPLVLHLAHLLATSPDRPPPGPRPWIVVPALAVIVVAVVAAAGDQVTRLRLEAWRGAAETALSRAGSLPTERRSAMLGALARQATDLATEHSGSSPWLHRLAGRAELARGHPVAAEGAFRASLARCVHEEALLGLGIALAGQGRAQEALPPLRDAVRVNASLLELIPDPTLRGAIEASLDGGSPVGGR